MSHFTPEAVGFTVTVCCLQYSFKVYAQLMSSVSEVIFKIYSILELFKVFDNTQTNRCGFKFYCKLVSEGTSFSGVSDVVCSSACNIFSYYGLFVICKTLCNRRISTSTDGLGLCNKTRWLGLGKGRG